MPRIVRKATIRDHGSVMAACRSLFWRHEVHWFHPNGGWGPSRLVCDEKGVGCGKRLESGAQSVNHSLSGRTSALPDRILRAIFLCLGLGSPIQKVSNNTMF
jgi:hypothetical protein